MQAKAAGLVEVEVGRTRCGIEIRAFEIVEHFVYALAVDMFFAERLEACFVVFDFLFFHGQRRESALYI